MSESTVENLSMEDGSPSGDHSDLHLRVGDLVFHQRISSSIPPLVMSELFQLSTNSGGIKDHRFVSSQSTFVFQAKQDTDLY